MTELLLEAKQIARLRGVTDRAIRRQLEILLAPMNGTRNLYEREMLSPRGGGLGGRMRKYDVERLAEKFPGFLSAEQLAAARSEAADSATLQLFDSATPAGEITVTNGAILEKPATALLPFEKPEITAAIRAIENPRQAAWAAARASVIEPLRSWQNWKKQTVHGFHIQKLGDLVNALAADSKLKHGALLDWNAIRSELRRALDDHDAEISPVSAGTLWRWWTWFAKGRTVAGRKVAGIEALADAPPKTAGRSKFAAAFPQAAAYFVSKVLYEGLNHKHAYDSMMKEWPTLAPAGTEPPDYSTCRRLLEKPQELPQHIRELAEMGPRKYFAERGPSIKRERPAPMAWWVLDHRNHDVHVANDCFPEKSPGERMRPWVTLIIDWGSNCIVGYCFSPTPSSITINSAMRMAVASYGFPPNLYWDRGKDFQRVQRILQADDALNSALTGRCTITRALPYNARAKVVEGHFATWSARFDREFTALGAYAGRTRLHRPEATAHALKQHTKFLDGKVLRSSLPLATEFITQAVLAIDEHNATPREILGGLTPLESLAQGNPPPAPLGDRRLLDGLFFERDSRVVGRGGAVQLDKLTYIPKLEWQAQLSAWSGQSISVSRDPYDLREAAAYDLQSGKFIGELEIQPLTPQSANGQDPLSREGMKRKARACRELRESTARYIAALTQNTRAAGYRTELEARLARAGQRPLLAAAAPSAVSTCPERSRRAEPAASPFVSDAVRTFLSSEGED